MLRLVLHAVAQDNGAQQPLARQQLQHIHTPQSIDQKLAQLTKDLELNPQQQEKVRPLLEEHHDKIQALLDKNPTKSRQALGPQIHAISDETHRQIHALITDHQKELEKAMLHHEHNAEEHRRSARLRQCRQGHLLTFNCSKSGSRSIVLALDRLIDFFRCPILAASRAV